VEEAGKITISRTLGGSNIFLFQHPCIFTSHYITFFYRKGGWGRKGISRRFLVLAFWELNLYTWVADCYFYAYMHALGFENWVVLSERFLFLLWDGVGGRPTA